MDEYNNTIGATSENMTEEVIASPEIPEAPETNQSPEIPEASETNQSPEIPDASETNQAPEAPQSPDAPVPPQAPQIAEAPEKTDISEKTKAPKQKKPISNIISTILITIIISAGLVALAISVFSYVVNVSGYTTALDKFMDVIIYENIDEMESIMPAEAWEYLAKENDMDKDELVGYLQENAKAQEVTIDDMENFQYSITSAEELDANKCSEIGEMLNENYGMSPNCAERAFKIKFEYSFEYDDEDYNETETAYAVKINGQWYLTNTDGEFGDFMD